ncbi:helical backbone metal receptor [Halobellus ruber]|uniref:ABC transporter substrate-binding protein n=1 Tax=Halobellus ruber TaxID=2761102 RepID=A0A7J9SG62_9EURY|nr:helical backbone metal receptor [Halobellus ruber]MBB6645708.1 ABC transporter substrate-binding protein [Halobellus ruber]
MDSADGTETPVRGRGSASGERSGGPTPDGDAPARVVSLAPSATATLSAMDAGDAVVGVTAHCNLDRPRVGGWLNPDYDRLADLNPDLVCTADPLQADVRDELRDRGYEVCHVEPATLDAVVDSFETLGRAAGRPDAGARLAADARDRLAAVRERVPDAGSDGGDARPVVYCEEWGDPPMAAGNWVPEAVEVAGGRYPFCDPGDRSREVSAERVGAVEPDHVVIHHCGHGDRADPGLLEERGWTVDATAHVLDDDLLNQPSPALLDGIERLAGLFHGEG